MFQRVKEYIKLLPTIMANRELIFEGIVNSVKEEFHSLSEDEQEEMIRRRTICETCIYMSTNAKNNPALNYKSERPEKHCMLCGCAVKLKTASLSANCGIERWNQQHPNNQMELKWTAYKPKTNENDTA